MKLNDLNLQEDTIKFSDTLNKDIWVGEILKPQVYNKLKQIATAFIEYLDLNLDITDIQFTGSMANFNFNPDSDIDLHIIVNFNDYDINSDLLQDYFNAKKTIFNNNHDISIYGHPVELYVEDAGKPAEAGGKYSIKYDKWLKKPEKITQQVEDVKDSPKYKELVNRIQNILSSNYNSEEATSLLNELYNMRKKGLSSGGELSEENLIFKKLRSNGLISDLRDYINKNYDKSLSLEESIIKEDVNQDKSLRDLAITLSNICKETLIKSSYPLIYRGNSIFINITKAFKKTSHIIKNSPLTYFIELSNNSEEETPAFYITDAKQGVIVIPIFNDSLDEILKKILNTHKKQYENLSHKYSNAYDMNYLTELNKLTSKYIRLEIKKLINNMNDLDTTLVHECIHLIDNLRYKSTYYPFQNIETEEDLKNYWNSPDEQNAYYQETIAKFDNWIKQNIWKISNWETFKDFYVSFIIYYKGNYNQLNEKNKLKLMKRAFQYWKIISKKPKYQDFLNVS